MTSKRWQDWLTLALGIWVAVSPWVYGFNMAAVATANAVIIGAVIALYSLIELSAPRIWEEWLMVLAGIWLLISPWVLGFEARTQAVWNTALSGIAIALLAVWALGQFGAERRTPQVPQQPH